MKVLHFSTASPIRVFKIFFFLFYGRIPISFPAVIIFLFISVISVFDMSFPIPLSVVLCFPLCGT